MIIENVVIIDDDEDIRLILAATLGALTQWNITEIADPRDASAAIASIAPEVLILDWMMPHISGVELFDQLSRENALDETTVIFMTAKVQISDRTLIESLGAHLIEKPFDPMTIPAQVRKITGAGHGDQINAK